MKKSLSALFPVLLAASMLVSPAGAQAPDDDEFGDDYRQGDYGRILYEENGVSIIRADAERAQAERTEDGTINAPVFPGDTIRTTRNQRVEVELAGGTLVRVAQDTELTFLSLPSPYASYRDNTVLQLLEGSVRISARVGDDQEFRIDTPASSVYLLGDGDYRIEADSRGRTLVYSWRGVAELAGNGGSVLVRAGMRTEALPGSVPLDPESFNTFASDGFDRWVARRDEQYRVRNDYGYDRYDTGGYEADPAVYDELPREVRPYYGELSRSGRWVWVDDYGWCWYPRGIASGWRPYSDGYWAYGPHGYFWVSYESWGWAPYHYGRWSYVSHYGWCWVPGRVFAGAWVSWSWGSLHVGWSPLDYWNRPAYYGRLYYGHYDPYCWTFVSYRHLHHRRIHHVAVGVHDIGDGLRRHAIVTRAPRVAPRALAEDPGARTRAVVDTRDRARARPVAHEGDRRPQRFTDMEDRIATRARREGPSADRSRPAERARIVRSGPSRHEAPEGRDRREREIGVENGRRPIVDGGAPARFPRRIEPGSDAASNPGRRTTVPAPRSERSGPPPATREPAARRAAPDREDVQERRRDLYRRMSRPQETRTREQADRPAPSQRTERQAPSARSPRPAERRPPAVNRPAPSRSAPERRSAPPSVRRDRPAAPPARVERSSPRSAPRPSASRPAPSRSAPPPKASPRRSSGGSQPKARPSGSSGGSKSGSKSKGSRRGGKKDD